MALINRLRAWINTPAPDDAGTVETALRAPSDHTDASNVDRSKDPQVRARIADEADRLSHGHDVVLPRGVANYAENLIIRIFDRDALREIGYGYDDLTVAGCRKAISDAISQADSRHWTSAGSVTIGGDNHGAITTGRNPEDAAAEVLRDVLAAIDASETGNPGMTHADAVAAVRYVATERGIIL